MLDLAEQPPSTNPEHVDPTIASPRETIPQRADPTIVMRGHRRLRRMRYDPFLFDQIGWQGQPSVIRVRLWIPSVQISASSAGARSVGAIEWSYDEYASQGQANAPLDARNDAVKLSGPVLPGLVNAHSHAFQRAIAGLTECRRASAETSAWPRCANPSPIWPPPT